MSRSSGSAEHIQDVTVSRKLVTTAVIVGVVVIVGVLVAIVMTRPDAKLAALKEDPMATAQPANTSEVRRFESESGTALGKPVYPEVLRVITISGDPQDALEEASQDAETAGWQATNRTETVSQFRKPIEGMDSSLMITVSAAGALGAPVGISGPWMTITLTGLS